MVPDVRSIIHGFNFMYHHYYDIAVRYAISTIGITYWVFSLLDSQCVQTVYSFCKKTIQMFSNESQPTIMLQ